MMELPQAFTVRMKELLGQEEYTAFIESYEKERTQGLRFNPLKTENGFDLAKTYFQLKPIPWTEDGYYYPGNERPGKHPYHEAGLYYIQEPSAMAVAELAAPLPGEWVLDLCAAPGGKSTHLAGKMKGMGVLVCNEIHPARAKILSQNIERMGIGNSIITNEDSGKLAQRFGLVFDRIIIDVPCSGEGMFRKDEEARLQWSRDHVTACAARQSEILDNGAAMLKPGGRLVYSTCTFAPEENEESIRTFLQRHPEFEIEKPEISWEGFSPGNPLWTKNPEHAKIVHIEDTIRIWPHRTGGEGHYLAVLKKKGVCEDTEEREFRNSKKRPLSVGQKGGLEKLKRQTLECFLKETLTEKAAETLLSHLSEDWVLFGDQLYLLPKGCMSRMGRQVLDGLRVVRAGLHLGTFKKNRFEPSHSLALFLHPEEVRSCKSLHLSDHSQCEETASYLKGMSLTAGNEKGWTLIAVDGCSLGWVKQAGDVLKNHYPKGLRWVSE